MKQTTDTTFNLSRRQIGGFSYIIVLAAIVIVGIMAEVTTTLASHEVRVDREAELLHRGLAYRRAIESYYKAGKLVKQFPRSLEDLAKDPRFPKRHHIRQVYPDPMGRDKKEWTLVRAPDGGIAGVASQSDEEPIKQANFPKDFEKFAGAKAYSEWIFEFVPPPPPPPIRVPGAPAAPPLVAPPVLKTN